MMAEMAPVTQVRPASAPLERPAAGDAGPPLRGPERAVFSGSRWRATVVRGGTVAILCLLLAWAALVVTGLDPTRLGAVLHLVAHHAHLGQR